MVFYQTGGGGVSEGTKKPNPFFGVLKRVKNALKWLKITKKHDKKFSFRGKNNQTGGGLVKNHTFPPFF